MRILLQKYQLKSCPLPNACDPVSIANHSAPGSLSKNKYKKPGYNKLEILDHTTVSPLASVRLLATG